MKRTLIRTALWLLLAGSTVTAPSFLSPTANAQSGVAAIVTYYSDSTRTVVVGTTIIHCDGTITKTGTQTQFSKTRIGECAPQ